MAKRNDQKAGARGKDSKLRMTYTIAAAIAFVAIVAASYFAISTLYHGTTSGGFSAFKANFYSAPRVAIYATAYNGTVLSGTVGCATAIIENIVANAQAHRNSSTIDFFIINQTACTYVAGLGMSNGTETTVGSCLNMSGMEPTIYINYSLTNRTVVTPNYLYTSGDRLFLSECGIATELG